MTGPIDLAFLKREHARFLREHDTMVDEEMAGAATEVAPAVYETGLKRRTGALQRETKARVIKRGGKTLVLRASNALPYAKALEDGSPAHEIRAKGKALRFVSGGVTFFRRRVQHPGNKAYRFLSRATEKAHHSLGDGLQSGMARVAKRF